MPKTIRTLIARFLKRSLDFFYPADGNRLNLKIFLFVLSFFSYFIFLSLQLTVIILFSIAIHESGHVYAMRKLGKASSGFYFIPFLGGVAPISYETLRERATISIMGPLFGSLSVSFCVALAALTKVQFFWTVAYFGAIFNLFNMIPINPLDGGQIINSICFSIHRRAGDIFSLLSIVVSAFLATYFKSFIFAVILIMAFIDFIGRRKMQEYIEMKTLSPTETLISLIEYALISASLALGYQIAVGSSSINLFSK